MKPDTKLILALLIIVPSFLGAQLPYLNTKSILTSVRHLNKLDSATYKLYTEQKWDSLYRTGKQIINSKKYNYYILVRTATSAYYLERYSLAIKYLHLAKQLFPSDPYVDELLYYSYLYSGKKMQAHALAMTFRPNPGKKLLTSKYSPSAYIESGPVLSQTLKPLQGKETDLYNDRISDNGGFYLLIGYQQPVSAHMSICGSISKVILNKQRDVNIRYLDTLSGTYDVNQDEYYVSSDVLLRKRFIISPSINISVTKVTEPIVSNDSVINLYLGSPIKSNYKNYVAGGELSYSANYWTLTAGAWYIDLNNKKSYQTLSSFMIMPKGNLNLYSKTTLTYLPQRMNESFILKELIGFKISKKIWAEVSGTYGNLANTAEQNGQLINNQVSKTNYRTESLLILDMSKALRLTARYQFSENNNLYYKINSENSLIQSDYISNKHVITGGITWFIQ